MTTPNAIPVVLTREALYEQVWATPVLKLAKQYGLSDVGLAKACKRLQVPRPPLGYWAKKSAGKRVSRPPLPVVIDPSLQQVKLTPTPPPPAQNPPGLAVPAEPVPSALRDPEIASAYERFTQAFPSIEVPSALRSPLPIVSLTLEGLRKSAREHGNVGPDGIPRLHGAQNIDDKPPLDVCVSRGQFERAARFLNTLLRTFEACGWELTLNRYAYRPCRELKVLSQNFGLRLRESTERHVHTPTSKELAEKERSPHARIPKWDEVPCGRLTLSLTAPGPGNVVRSWTETKTAPLEMTIGHIVREVFEEVDRALMEWRQQQEVVRRQMEQSRVRAEQEQIQQQARDRVAALTKEIEGWELARRIRRYVRGAEQLAMQLSGTKTPNAEFAKWRTWALSVADCCDPLTQARIHATSKTDPHANQVATTRRRDSSRSD